MFDNLDPLAVAKQPTQQRARDRFDRILQEAEAILIEQGLSGFSIPAIAERLGYTRGSVYAYFPTPYAILNELVSRYLVDMEKVFVSHAGQLGEISWQDGIRLVVEYAVGFHNAHPAARLLLLGGAITDDSYRAQEQTNKRLGDLARRLWNRKLTLPTVPDVTTLCADIGAACFRRSFFEHAEITPAYSEAAVAAMTHFITPYVDEALRKRGTSAKRTALKL